MLEMLFISDTEQRYKVSGLYLVRVVRYEHVHNFRDLRVSQFLWTNVSR